MRIRSTTTGGFTTPNVLAKYRISDGLLISPGVTTYSGAEKVKFVKDVVTANFFTLQESGGFLPLNPFEVNTTETTITAGSGSEDYAAHDSRWTGSFVPNWTGQTLFVPELTDSLRDAAVLSAAANASQAAFDVSTWLGEFNDTVGTMKQVGGLFATATSRMAEVAYDLARIARSSRKPKALKKFKGNPRSAFDQFSDLWLLGRYGIRPLIYDFYSAQKAMEVLMKGTTIVRGRGRTTESDGDSVVTTGTLDAQTDVTWAETLTWERSYNGFAYCQFSSSKQAAFQFNPLVTAWELTPYSFIIDWFIDVGSWVQTLTPRMNGDYLGIALGVHTRSTHTITYREDTHSGVVGSQSGASKVTVVNSYTRGSAEIPFPPLLPRLDIPKVIDLVAIFLGGKGKVGRTLSRR